jgi:hypothetical protein
MSSRYYAQHSQENDGMPRLSIETNPKIKVSHPSAEASPELLFSPPYTSPHPKANVAPYVVSQEPSERMEQHIRDVVEVGEYHNDKLGGKRVRVS